MTFEDLQSRWGTQSTIPNSKTFAFAIFVTEAFVSESRKFRVFQNVPINFWPSKMLANHIPRHQDCQAEGDDDDRCVIDIIRSHGKLRSETDENADSED